MAYTTIDDPTIYFNTKLYTGNAAGRTISGIGFQPDWTWSKNRGNDDNHYVFDSVRGATKHIIPDNNTAEGTISGITSWNSDGYVLGDSATINADGVTAVSWNWKAGTSFSNDASSTSVGSIDSAGSVNTDAGFSIITYTGTGTAGTIAHGLGKLPKMIIAKQRNATENWIVYFLDTSIANNNVQNYLELDTNIASTGDSGARWGAYGNYSTTTFGVGTDDQTNKSGSTYVAYVFSDIQAYSKIGKYAGNGNADGPFVYTGFKPAFVMVKNRSAAEHWIIFDNKRPGRNLTDALLKPSLHNVESTSGVKFDLLSNGFKARVSDAEGNSSGHTFIYMAFAESPFVTSTGVPATAR